MTKKKPKYPARFLCLCKTCRVTNCPFRDRPDSEKDGKEKGDAEV